MSFSPALHYSDPAFVSLSFSHPIQFIHDRSSHGSIRFRHFGPEEPDDAIIFFPGIYETCSSSIFLLAQLEQAGYRALSVDFSGVSTFGALFRSFQFFCSQQKINRVHLIGADFGGFQVLQLVGIQTWPIQLSPISLILINSYTNLTGSPDLPAKFKVFGKLAAKSVLLEELSELTGEKPTSATIFVSKEVDSMEGEAAANRLSMKTAKSHQNVPSVQKQAILSIEAPDRRIVTPDEAIPSIAMKGIRTVMAAGGDWPHILQPQAIAAAIIEHLKEYWTQES
jgi:hypothetical protein